MKRNLIVIGASAGGVNALIELTSELSADLDAAVLVVQHIGRHPSLLPGLLRRRLPARHAVNGMRFEPGTIYVAPPDRHLLVDGDTLRLSVGPKENLTRPAIDPLFRSAAVAAGPRVIGVLLTGHLDDGTAGLVAIKQSGGVTIVQDPLDADVPAMPSHALAFLDPDHCAPLRQIPELLARLTAEPVTAPVTIEPSTAELENALSMADGRRLDALFRIGKASGYTCPSCSGALFTIDGSRPPRYRCHTGHSFSHAALLVAQQEACEDALWTALRSLQEFEGALRGQAAQWESRDADIARKALNRADAVGVHIASLRAMVEDYVRDGDAESEGIVPSENADRPRTGARPVD